MGALELALALASASPAAALTSEGKQLIVHGLDRAYALELQAAATAFQQVADSEPDDPAGPLFLAGLAWVQYAQTFDVLEGGGALQTDFLTHTEEAIRRAEAGLKKDPRDAHALMCLGAAWGYRGRWKVLERSWVAAARLGLKGYRYLKRAVEADPGLYDAYLGLGIYEYYADTMPAVIRILKSLVVGGDKKRGIGYIKLAMERGTFSKTEARLFLVGIYSGPEKDYEEALRFARELRDDKPGNPYFSVLELAALMHLKRWQEAARAGDRLLVEVLHRSPSLREPGLFYLYAGEAYQGLGEHERAVDYFTWGLAACPDRRKAAATYLLLRRGQSHDRLGKRDLAVESYREVAQRKDFFDSVPKAQAGLKAPVTEEELLRQLEE